MGRLRVFGGVSRSCTLSEKTSDRGALSLVEACTVPAPSARGLYCGLDLHVPRHATDRPAGIEVCEGPSAVVLCCSYFNDDKHYYKNDRDNKTTTATTQC